MEASIISALFEAATELADPYRLALIGVGVVVGLLLGVIPGIGGTAGMALLLPLTFNMDPYSAFAMLLGMVAVVGTSDTIPAVLFGVPGTSGAQATVLDGNAMAKRGEVGRALGAAYASSLIGGLFGALLLALTIPVLRPVMLHINTPELLAFTVFGIAMVASLSGSSPIRGLIVACFGILLSMVGSDFQTGTFRWTFDTVYLWEGFPLIPFVLGLFALPELADLAIGRHSIATGGKINPRAGVLRGMKDAVRNWWLVVRCSTIGAGIGALPGLGASVVDWIAYGHALQTVKGARKTFGKGDVRGVIAPESANNAITAGTLVPTLAFGVPGSAAMAILLGAFLIHGLQPGPTMLDQNLSLTYAMVWSIAIANILGVAICLLMSRQLARVAALRYSLIIPFTLTFVLMGSFQATRSWGDLYTLLAFGVLGWVMKQLKWPRPPLILGFVLGALIERYLHISLMRYGLDMFTRPVVAVVFLLAVIVVLVPTARRWTAHFRRQRAGRGVIAVRMQPADSAYLLAFLCIGWMVWEASGWPRAAGTSPLVVGIAALALCVLGFLGQLLSRSTAGPAGDAGEEFIHMDTSTDHSSLSMRMLLQRGATFFGYLVAYMVLGAIIGFLPAIPLFVIMYMKIEGKENWGLTAIYAALTTLFVYVVFDWALRLPWPSSLIQIW